MSINLFTLLVQTFNFLVLVFLLNKILFKPILKTLEERRKSIQDKIDETDRRLEEVNEEKKLYEEKLLNFESFEEEKKNQLTTELDEKKNRSLEELKRVYSEKEQQLKQQLEADEDVLIRKISANICENVAGFLNDVFTSLSDSSLDTRIVEKFVVELKTLAADKIAKINELLANESVQLLSSSALTTQHKEMIENTLKEIGVKSATFNYTEDKELGLGIKLKIGTLNINSNTQDMVEQFNLKLKQLL